MPFPLSPFYAENCIKNQTRTAYIRKYFVWGPGHSMPNKMFPDLAQNRQEYFNASSDTAVYNLC